MNVRSLTSLLPLALTCAWLAACSPPASGPDDPSADAPPAATAAPDGADASAAAPARERRASASAAPAASGYRYIDESGQPRLAARLEDVPERQRSTATPIGVPAARRGVPAEIDGDRPYRHADVTIYTTRGCGYCRAAMAYFDKLGLDYVNRDVEVDEEARADYLELTGGRRGVPVIVVGDAWLQGWSQPEFDRLLAASR